MIHSSFSILKGLFVVLLFASFFTLPGIAVETTQHDTVISTSVSEVEVIVDESIKNLGYVVNDEEYTGPVYVLLGGDVVVCLKSNPSKGTLSSVIEGDAEHDLYDYSVRLYNIKSAHVTLRLTLSGGSPNTDTTVTPPKPYYPPSVDEPEEPDTPDVPTEPENPDTPDTPGTDEPGSDEPLIPILPPAGIVYNIAGFASLIAGFLLLFLLFFMRGNLVYRTLKKHAKEHGEKPDKEEKKHLKEIASAVVSRIRDDEKYPEWKKNSDVMKHLGVDICLLLDEMKYREAVPREALVIEILEKARGKINRHRL